jgi:hypothetical protein
VIRSLPNQRVVAENPLSAELKSSTAFDFAPPPQRPRAGAGPPTGLRYHADKCMGLSPARLPSAR